MATSLEAPPQLQQEKVAEVRPQQDDVPVLKTREETAEYTKQVLEVEKIVAGMSRGILERVYLRYRKDYSGGVLTAPRYDQRALLQNLDHFTPSLVLKVLLSHIPDDRIKKLDAVVDQMQVFG